ncbi:hypothetical protein [Streptomyces sp. NPDC002640]
MGLRPSIDEAGGLLEAELGARQRTTACPSVGEVWEAFLRFGRQLFDVAEVPDGDGLLFQYGTYAFDGPPTFMVDLVRQFEVLDPEGHHDHCLQLHCEIRFGPEPALEALRHVDSWFFHGAGDDLEEWAREVTEQSAWATVLAHTPTGVRVFQERV